MMNELEGKKKRFTDFAETFELVVPARLFFVLRIFLTSRFYSEENPASSLKIS